MTDMNEPTTKKHVEAVAAKNGNHMGPYKSDVE
jgi:hypothetical protein